MPVGGHDLWWVGDFIKQQVVVVGVFVFAPVPGNDVVFGRGDQQAVVAEVGGVEVGGYGDVPEGGEPAL